MLSTIVKTWSPALVVSMDSVDESEEMQAWSQVKRAVEDLQNCEVVHCGLSNFWSSILWTERAAELSARKTSFRQQPHGHAYVLVPTVCSGPSDQDLNLLAWIDWIHQQKFTMQTSCWRQFRGLQSRLFDVLLTVWHQLHILPEDFGGHAIHGLSSLWALRDFRLSDGVDDARRGAVFFCRFAGADQKAPSGIQDARSFDKVIPHFSTRGRYQTRASVLRRLFSR